jgi:CDP-paratose 2-epimerase
MNIFITGGAGFIGCNLAHHYLMQGHAVTLFDNLSRRGADKNLAWLQENHGTRLQFIRGDVRDYPTLVQAVTGTDCVFHMASQVAVTSSVTDPRTDFEINALGTFNVLEAVRKAAPQAMVFYASTNKVYGGMEQVAVVEEPARYRYRDFPGGIPETQLLDFHSPYGCSKGAGDQYVRDYARIYGLKTVVFRQSCIYGTRQFGVEDQGWVAHFCIAAALGRPITIYGNGKQVRDVLWIDDLVRAYDLAAEHMNVASGRIYNIGGGSENVMSVWAEFGPILEELAGHSIQVKHSDWRPGDQPVYISDISLARRELGWSPHVGLREGIQKLWNWVRENPALFKASPHAST